MKPWIVHYMNKYPGGSVDASERCISVWNAAGEKVVQLEKDGKDNWVDRSEESGCLSTHSLAPIPRDARIWKLTGDGKIERDELAIDRKKSSMELAQLHGGCVPSIVQLVQMYDNPKLIEKSWQDTRWEWSSSPAREKVMLQIEAKKAAAELEHNPPIAAEFARVEDAAPAAAQS